MGLPTAPESQRVDLAPPTFSNPTSVTNPLFPVSSQFRVLQLGQVDGLPFRAEVTLLSNTRTIDLDGKPVETLVSQYVAFLDGRIHETALDHYAQADDGATWYFGEDVFNYEDGLIADTRRHLAGGQGRTRSDDHACGSARWVMCSVRRTSVGSCSRKSPSRSIDVRRWRGLEGRSSGAIAVQELHMDGFLEDKTFAPGYGEFTNTSAEDDIEAVALAVTTDALPGLPPKELEMVSAGAAEIFDAAQAEDWEAATTSSGGDERRLGGIQGG